MTKYKLKKCLKSLRYVYKFLDTYGVRWGDCWWKDADGDGFDTDQGYLVEGIDAFEKYLLRKLNKGGTK